MSRALFFRRPRSQRPRPGKTRLYLERLEDRTVPSVTVLNDFQGLVYDPVPPGRGLPPDTQVAVGPGHFVEVANRNVAFFNQKGHQEFQQSLSDFFAPVGASAEAGKRPNDNRTSYDELAGRFIVAAYDADFTSQTSHLFVAISDDSDPNGAWEMHRLDLTDTTGGKKLMIDYPSIGWDADAIYVTANMYYFDGSGFDHVSVITIDKASVLDNNNATITYFDVDLTMGVYWHNFTLQPAVMHGAQPDDPMYFVQTSAVAYGKALEVVQMTDKLSAKPKFADFKVPVPNYDFPPLDGATQPGGGTLDTTLGGRILNAAWRGGRLLASLVVGTDGVARARWYEFDTTGKSPTLTQSGEINQGPGVYTYYPSIEIAPNGDLGMTFMESSASEYMSMYITGQKLGDPAGVMQTPVLVKAGEATYTVTPSTIDPPPYRVGDLSGIGIDPVTGTFWAANEYATPPLKPSAGDILANWGTWIGNFVIRSGATAMAGASMPAATTGAAGPALAASGTAATPAATASSLPALSINDVTLPEGNPIPYEISITPFVFTVSLSAASTQTVTEDYATDNGTANYTDYQAQSGTLTFAPGQTSQDITIFVYPDNFPENDEKFYINLSNPTNAAIKDGTGVGKILNDDCAKHCAVFAGAALAAGAATPLTASPGPFLAQFTSAILETPTQLAAAMTWDASPRLDRASLDRVFAAAAKGQNLTHAPSRPDALAVFEEAWLDLLGQDG